MKHKTDINLFLGLLVFSLIGNICADYALLWHGLKIISSESSLVKDHTLSYFYIGQAFGVVFLSPLCSVFFDRLAKLPAALLLDGFYILTLLVMLLFFKLNLLSASWVFVFSSITSSLAIIHKSAIAFSAIQKVSEQFGVTDVVSKFMAALNLPFLIGSALSGVVFQYFGFVGCVLVGVITFLPMPFIYLKLFKSDSKALFQKRKSKFLLELKEGFLTLTKDKLLLWTALSISIVNIAAAILPTVVGYSFLQKFPDRTDYASIFLSISMLGGILLTKAVGNIARNWRINLVVPYSVLLPSLMLIISFFFPNPFIIAGMFFLSCIGSAARNVSSGSLRVSRVAKDQLGRVNTVYSSLLYLGQAIGGVFIVNAVQNNMQSAVLLILACFCVASVVSFAFLPPEVVSTILEEKK